MSEAAAQERRIAEALRLRAAPPQAVRLSRRAVVLSALIAGTALAAVLAWGLRAPSRSPDAAEAVSAEDPRPSEHLAGLPRDYAEAGRRIPDLGPPLPGDLGRAMLDPATPGAVPGAGGAGSEAGDLAARARASGLFGPSTASPGPADVDPAPAVARAAAGPADPAAEPRRELRRLAAGTVVRAALITGIRSDLPGPVLAQVTENVHDSLHGATLLIPQGSRLLGTYDHQVAFGQDRVLLTWERLVLPDGRAVDLETAAATDAAGQAGLSDRVDRKWRSLIGASLVALGLSAATALTDEDGSEDALLRALRRGGSDVASQAAGQVVGRSLQLRPSLTIRPGFPVRVLLTADLDLQPWTAP